MDQQLIKLTPEQTNAVHQTRQILAQLRYELDRAHACNVPNCQQLEKVWQELTDGLAKIEQTYGATQ